MPELFDMKLRALRRNRAARVGVELFLYDRAFGDCLERIALQERRFDRALLIGCPAAAWPERMKAVAAAVEIRDPGPLFACMAGGTTIAEDAWQGHEAAYDLVVSIGTLDAVNGLPLALRSVRYAMSANGFFIGALTGGDTLPQLRSAMRAADATSGIAAPHVHPRIQASALSPLLADAGFANPVVDVDRVTVLYPSFQRLVGDLRSMGATNILTARPRFIGREARATAAAAFATAGNGERTAEILEILHFAAWTPKQG
jgi:NADH dehydrogenase [ubiquinone] 1 alpha subcomplex assembly factor 5